MLVSHKWCPQDPVLCQSCLVSPATAWMRGWRTPSVRRCREHLLTPCLKGGGTQLGVSHLSQVISKRTGGNDLRLCQRKVRLDIRDNFFTRRVLQPWHWLTWQWWTPHHYMDVKAIWVWHLGTRDSDGLGSAGEGLNSVVSKAFSN